MARAPASAAWLVCYALPRLAPSACTAHHHHGAPGLAPRAIARGEHPCEPQAPLVTPDARPQLFSRISHRGPGSTENPERHVCSAFSTWHTATMAPPSPWCRPTVSARYCTRGKPRCSVGPQRSSTAWGESPTWLVYYALPKARLLRVLVRYSSALLCQGSEQLQSQHFRAAGRDHAAATVGDVPAADRGNRLGA